MAVTLSCSELTKLPTFITGYVSYEAMLAIWKLEDMLVCRQAYSRWRKFICGLPAPLLLNILSGHGYRLVGSYLGELPSSKWMAYTWIMMNERELSTDSRTVLWGPALMHCDLRKVAIERNVPVRQVIHDLKLDPLPFTNLGTKRKVLGLMDLVEERREKATPRDWTKEKRNIGINMPEEEKEKESEKEGRMVNKEETTEETVDDQRYISAEDITVESKREEKGNGQKTNEEKMLRNEVNKWIIGEKNELNKNGEKVKYKESTEEIKTESSALYQLSTEPEGEVEEDESKSQPKTIEELLFEEEEEEEEEVEEEETDDDLYPGIYEMDPYVPFSEAVREKPAFMEILKKLAEKDYNRLRSVFERELAEDAEEEELEKRRKATQTSDEEEEEDKGQGPQNVRKDPEMDITSRLLKKLHIGYCAPSQDGGPTGRSKKHN